MAARTLFGRWWLVVVTLVTTVVLGVLFSAVLAPLTVTDAVRVQFIWDPESFFNIFRRWAYGSHVDRYVMFIGLDGLFAVSYWLLLTSALALALRVSGLAARWDALLLVPAAAGLLDLIENALHLSIIGAGLPPGAVTVAAAVSLVKFACVLATIVAIAVTAFAAATARARGQRTGDRLVTEPAHASPSGASGRVGAETAIGAAADADPDHTNTSGASSDSSTPGE